MMLGVTCPYCEAEFKDENEDFGEGETYEAECRECGKVFGYSISISISTSSCELPCGGQDGVGPHEWIPCTGFPEEYFKGRYHCAHCGLEKVIEDVI